MPGVKRRRSTGTTSRTTRRTYRKPYARTYRRTPVRSYRPYARRAATSYRSRSTVPRGIPFNVSNISSLGVHRRSASVPTTRVPRRFRRDYSISPGFAASMKKEQLAKQAYEQDHPPPRRPWSFYLDVEKPYLEPFAKQILPAAISAGADVVGMAVPELLPLTKTVSFGADVIKMALDPKTNAGTISTLIKKKGPAVAKVIGPHLFNLLTRSPSLAPPRRDFDYRIDLLDDELPYVNDRDKFYGDDESLIPEPYPYGFGFDVANDPLVRSGRKLSDIASEVSMLDDDESPEDVPDQEVLGYLQEMYSPYGGRSPNVHSLRSGRSYSVARRRLRF